MESRPTETRDLPALARERVRVGPAAPWIDPAYYDKNFRAKIPGQITYLLIERQVHAELGQIYVRLAMRLETQQAVQTQSQWRLEFEPQTQSIVLHSVKIRRGDLETEHASPDRLQYLQRESGLDGYVIHGWITLLLLLEDVRPGDVLEFSYTLTNKPKILPDHVASFLALPAGTEIGRYHFLVRHAETRAVKWKSSAPKLAPKITTENSEVCWDWLDVQVVSPAPEEFTPSGCILFPWIQVSDCPDWKTVAQAVLEAWKDDPPGEALTRLIEEVTSFSPDPPSRVARAIEMVQDGFRYLSFSVELGGQIPAPPETVVRRRYGDCKDLAFLLVKLLRALDIPARPVLVNTTLRQSITSMLPSPGMFNHCIVEYEIGGERRWVDATTRSQGGGALHRCISDFGVGLPIDVKTSELAPVPATSQRIDTWEVKESFILDTTGHSSYFGLLVTARGIHADALRFEFANESIEAISKKRSQACANRFFCGATRVGKLEYRDDRELNEFVIAEAFEIAGLLKEDKATRTCLFKIKSDFTAALVLPSAAPRREPFALPFPCHRTHTIEIDFAGLNAISIPVVQTGNRFLTFSRRARSGPKFLTVTFTLETLASSIPATEIPSHRKQVESIWQAGSLMLRLPSGYAKMRKRSDFGTLSRPVPSTPRTVPVALPAKEPPPAKPKQLVQPETVGELFPVQTTGPAVAHPESDQQAASPAAHRHRVRSTREESSFSRRRSRGNKMETRGVVSFFMFLGSFLGTFIAGYLARTQSTAALAGLLDLIVIPTLIWSLILAALGLRECSRYPGRFMESKLFAGLTIVFGGLFALCMVPGIIHGLRAVIAGAQARSLALERSREALDFKALNFVFHPPETPWRQANAKSIGRDPVLAFHRPDPLYFTVIVKKVLPDDADPMAHLVELSKKSIRNQATSYQLVDESPVTHKGISGWQIESQASVQGHDDYVVNWLLVTNGFAYQLTTWGPQELKSRVKDQSDQLNEDFELITP